VAQYLKSTRRAAHADLADTCAEHLRADPEVADGPERFYDRVVEIDLDQLEPHLVGPHTPDLDRPISKVKAAAIAEDYPLDISYALVGSCTNSSYEDIGRAAHVARQAKAAGLRVRSPLLITPGSEQVRATIERDGYLDDLEAIGATVLANACGPCIGQWQRDDIQKGDRNTIVSSFNRNFPARNDGNAATLSFIGSPETVTAMALTGRLDVDFVHDPIAGPDGAEVRLAPPLADELPDAGFDPGKSGFVAPAADGSTVEVVVAPGSDRLELLEPFPAWNGRDLRGLRVLMKAAGKCTTDHISPAGPWLRYRGHLTNISGNLFNGVNNAFSPIEPGTGIDVRDGSVRPLPELAKAYKEAGIAWIAVGDENYGEGSSREHAAMQPRYMGGRVVVVRSFARIHEANLKKQGVLALTFKDPGDYEKVRFDDTVDVLELPTLAPGMPVTVVLRHTDGTTDTFDTTHTMSAEHIAWFRAGSALNVLRSS
jgi:aconitate hydratase